MMDNQDFKFKDHVPEIITIVGGGTLLTGVSLWLYRDCKQGKINKEQIGGSISKTINTVSIIIKHADNAINDCRTLYKQ